MPIYEYECSVCGKFEVVQKVGDKTLKADPDCCRKNCPRNAKKLVSAAAFHLKGTGWYKTDYASSSSSSSGSSNGSSGSSSSDSSSADSTSSASSGDDSSGKEKKKTEATKKTESKKEKAASTSKAS